MSSEYDNFGSSFVTIVRTYSTFGAVEEMGRLNRFGLPRTMLARLHT